MQKSENKIDVLPWMGYTCECCQGNGKRPTRNQLKRAAKKEIMVELEPDEKLRLPS